MKRRLIFLNLLLAGLVAGSVYLLKQKAEQTRAHEQQILSQKVKPAAPTPLTPVVAPPPVAATNYVDVANKVLFARDRSPNPIIEVKAPPPPKKMPPLPFAYGIMDLGEGPTVIMAEKTGDPHKGYKIGDQIGEFKLKGVEGRELTLVWDDKEIKKRLDELEDKNAAQSAQNVTTQTVAAAPPPKPKEALPSTPEPGTDTGGGFKACRAGDNSPNGTVADGYKKVVNANPFGQSCHWEPVK